MIYIISFLKFLKAGIVYVCRSNYKTGFCKCFADNEVFIFCLLTYLLLSTIFVPFEKSHIKFFLYFYFN